MAEPVSKSQFAKDRGVSPGRVCQWIAEWKNSADAIIGEGQRTKLSTPTQSGASPDPVADQLRRETLEQAQVLTAKLRRDDCAAAGIYMRTDDVR